MYLDAVFTDDRDLWLERAGSVDATGVQLGEAEPALLVQADGPDVVVRRHQPLARRGIDERSTDPFAPAGWRDHQRGKPAARGRGEPAEHVTVAPTHSRNR